MASILKSFTVDADLCINVFVFYLEVITKCQFSWRTNALNTLPDFLNNFVHNEGNCWGFFVFKFARPYMQKGASGICKMVNITKTV